MPGKRKEYPSRRLTIEPEFVASEFVGITERAFIDGVSHMLKLTADQIRGFKKKGASDISQSMRGEFLAFLQNSENRHFFLELYNPRKYFSNLFLGGADETHLQSFMDGVFSIESLAARLREMKATKPTLANALEKIFATSLTVYNTAQEKMAFRNLLARSLPIEPVLHLIVEHFREELGHEQYFSIYYWYSYNSDLLEAFRNHRNAAQFGAIPIQTQEEVIFSRFNHRDITPLFWFDHPKFVKFIGQCLAAFPTPETMNWGERQYVFQLMMSQLGRHGVTDNELLQKIFALWQPNAEDFLFRQEIAADPDLSKSMADSPVRELAELQFYETFMSLPEDLPISERKIQAYATLTPVAQSALKRALYNGVAGVKGFDAGRHLSSPILQDLRRQIRQEKGIPEVIKPEEISGSAERTAWLENVQRHPLADYLPYVGIEIESAQPQEMQAYQYTDRFYWVMGEFCHNIGNDRPLELAPHPCLRPETACQNLDDLVNSGLLDLHAEKALSLHLNGGFAVTEVMAYLTRFHFLCGRGTHPVSTQVGQGVLPAWHTLKIFSKDSETPVHVPKHRQKYQEVKGLRLNTLAETKDILRLTSILGAAFRAYEKIFLEEYAFRDQTHLESVPIFDPESLLWDERISRSSYDPTTQALAKVCLAMVKENYELTSNHIHGVYWSKNIPMTASIEVGSVIRQVFPDALDHDDPSRLGQQASKKTIVHRGKMYPNLLVAAREIGEKYAAEVQEILNRYVDHLTSTLAEITQESNPYLRAKMRDLYLQRALKQDASQYDEIDSEIFFSEQQFRLINDPELQRDNYNKF